MANLYMDGTWGETRPEDELDEEVRDFGKELAARILGTNAEEVEERKLHADPLAQHLRQRLAELKENTEEG